MIKVLLAPREDQCEAGLWGKHPDLERPQEGPDRLLQYLRQHAQPGDHRHQGHPLQGRQKHFALERLKIVSSERDSKTLRH